MQRTGWFLALVAITGLAVLLAWRGQIPAQQNNPGEVLPTKAPAQALPLTQVVLFSSGVGYFQREGTVEGNARVDLTFPLGDVNDLLKSLVLLDMDPEKPTTVGYDSQEPVERTLQSFALNLTGNPTMGQLLNQARGEKVEIALQQTATGQPAVLTGVIMGMEAQHLPHGKDQIVDTDVLNLLCNEGLRAVPLSQVQRLRFLNAQLDTEFRRALEVLANSHNSQKRNLSLSLNGEGKRPIKLGYVVENPIWKTSYRLIHDRDGKVRLQGWALIENTSEDDWRDVRVTLVSSRPISYQMDLYQPLYVPRPTVEPERFASLRPPVFGGVMVDNNNQNPSTPAQTLLQQGQGNTFNLGGMPAGGGMLGIGGGFNGMQMGNQFGLNTAGNRNGDNNARFQNGNTLNFQQARLTFEEMQNRRQQIDQARDQARKIGSGVGFDPLSNLANAPEGEKVGDYFRYDINQSVTLPRLKSAMIPIVNHVLEGTPVSIFNERTHRSAPLLGLRLKNTTSHHLMAGPVTVFSGGAYAGDARLPDVQPSEQRLIAFGIDQGVEVSREMTQPGRRLIKATVQKGFLMAQHKQQESLLYLIKNRTPNARKVVVEHPYRSDFKLTSSTKPLERTRDLYRFEVEVKPGELAKLEVTEEREVAESVKLLDSNEDTIRIFAQSQVVGEPVKESLLKILGDRKQIRDLQTEVTQLQTRLKAITDDQTRLRANIDKVPQTSAAYKRYLEKFDTQETEIEKIQSEIETRQKSTEELTKTLARNLESLRVE